MGVFFFRHLLDPQRLHDTLAPWQAKTPVQVHSALVQQGRLLARPVGPVRLIGSIVAERHGARLGARIGARQVNIG